jgi:CarboxypepD_reg-like domain
VLKFFFFILYLSVIADTSAQLYIKGIVSDGNTNQPLKGASVYINNTTKGTVTDENGEFSLGPFEPGSYEVIASYVGYEPLLFTAQLKNAGYRISFRLEQKEKKLRDILIITDETRKKYLDLFKKNVLGFTDAAARCRIKNIEQVQFAAGETKNDIIAYADEELVIENPELGYIIRFELLDFYLNLASGETYFFGYTRYSELSKDGEAKKRFLKRRKLVYEGSTMHFFRSLVQKKLADAGFEVLQIVQAPKRTADSIKQSGTFRISSSGINGMQIAAKTNEEKMIRLYSDSGYRLYQLNIGDGWRVNYNKTTSLKQDLQHKNLLMGQSPSSTTSGLRLRDKTNAQPVLVNERGLLLTPMLLYYDFMWGYERLANMLPEDFEIDK